MNKNYSLETEKPKNQTSLKVQYITQTGENNMYDSRFSPVVSVP